MPLIPFTPPVSVPATGGHGFDYVTVDAARRRVYAAHGGNRSLLVVDADSGKVLGQVRVGPIAGVAVNAATGDVYTGDGEDDALSEVDPATMKEVHRVSVAGPVDAVAYDATYHRLYGDEDDGTRIFVIDTSTFKQVATVNLPGHKPEYLVIDPQTHDVYQNIATDGEIAAIDPKTLKVTRVIPTPDVKNNHPLQFDASNDSLLVGGTGVLSAYALDGRRLGTTPIAPHLDQCTYDEQRFRLACAANGGISLFDVPKNGQPKLVAQIAVGPHMHTVGIDSKTGRMWAVWGTPSGDFVQGFTYRP